MGRPADCVDPLIAHFQERAERAEERAEMLEENLRVVSESREAYLRDAEDWRDIAVTFRRLLITAEEALVDNIHVHGDWFSQCFFMTEPSVDALIIRWRDYRRRQKEKFHVPPPQPFPEEE